MKKTVNLLTLLVFAFAVWCHGSAIRLNSTFEGGNGVTVPGWSIAPGTTSAPGLTALYSTRTPRQFILRFNASQKRTAFCGDLVHLDSPQTEVLAQLSGSGTALLGVLAYDANQNPVPALNQLQGVALNSAWHDARAEFTLDMGRVSYIRVLIGVEPESQADFSSVYANFLPPAALPPFPGQLPPPPSSVAPIAPPAPSVAPVAPPVGSVNPAVLVDDQFVSIPQLAAAGSNPVAFVVYCRARKDIELNFEESGVPGQRWEVISYNPNMTRVKLKHERKRGRYKAEVEIDCLHHGSSLVRLQNGSLVVDITVVAQ